MPNRPAMQIFGQPEAPGVARTGEPSVVSRPQREVRAAMPSIPQPSAATPVTTVPQASTVESSARQLPADSTVAVTTSNLTRSKKRKLVDDAKYYIYSSMMTQEAIPSSNAKGSIIQNAINSAARDNMSVTNPKINGELSVVMATVRRLCRDYALCCIQHCYGLRLPLGQLEIEHKREHVAHLLTNHEYLKKTVFENNRWTTQPELFRAELFEDLVIDVFFLHNHPLLQHIQADNLDQLFALAAAAIYVSLKEFKEGYYTELPVSLEIWREPYVEVMALITDMRKDPEKTAQLTLLQQQMIEKGRSLRRSSQAALSAVFPVAN
ncbi:hypothetical protein JVT61DRAFT_8751 [Boletus reticuloceps]|uniref:DUF6532 domain-containing protein n=1 Tax=Boletus reticuloceps TaxID=495285 RepID=A0A8I2YHI7_9AGAM|nr:hypothetical protein JVT61DRAFT_8751 [Boletus reticuloceps]